MDIIINRRAAECVEELLDNVRHDAGVPWFVIIERKMRRLLSDYVSKAKR